MASEGNPRPSLTLDGNPGRLERPLGFASGHAFAGSLLGSLPTEDDIGKGGILHVSFLGSTAHCVSDQARALVFGREFEMILFYLFSPRTLFLLSFFHTWWSQPGGL